MKRWPKKKKYSVIYADPPWEYNDKANGKGARGGSQKHYKAMTLEEIKALPVVEIARPSAVLFLWCTWPMINEGLQVIKAWGFKYNTCGFVWVKANKTYKPGDPFNPKVGCGHSTRSNSEFCLIGKRGKGLKRKDASVRQIIHSPIEEHSKKPDETRDRIVQLYGNVSRIELFARQKVKGWDCWGDEV